MHALKLHRRRCVSTVRALVVALAAACIAPQRPSDVVVFASGTDLESGNPLVTVHPLSRQIQRFGLFVTLAKYDSLLTPVPYAAREWTWAPDRRALLLRLVPGLRWHDGHPTTAHDVAFTIDAARDPATGYWQAAALASVDSVLALDDTTVRIRFAVPQPSFPAVLCELPILPYHLLGATPRREMRRAPFNLQPVGNGPFEFVERRAGERWVFRRNMRFPPSLGGPPRLAGVVVTVVDEPTTKFAGLASGDLDVAGIAPTMAALAARDPSLRIVDYPILFSTGIVFNVQRPPFDDVRVRRAVSAAIDRRRIVRAALAGYGRAASGPVPPESRMALPTSPVFDPKRADSLFDASGWRRDATGVRRLSGRPLEFELTTVGSGDNALEQLVQSDLAARGVHVNIRQVEMAAFLTAARARNKSFDALVAGVPGDVALSFLEAMFESRQAGGALDYSGYHSATLDSLFTRVRAARTESERVAEWQTLQRALNDDTPVAWLYHSRGLQGMSGRLRNVVMDLRGELVTLAHWETARQ